MCVIVLCSGVISTFVSYVCKTATGRMGPSLGAVSVFLNDFQALCCICINVGNKCVCVCQSGAIMTVLAAVCTKMPEAKLAIIFLPMYTFTAGNVSVSEIVSVVVR